MVDRCTPEEALKTEPCTAHAKCARQCAALFRNELPVQASAPPKRCRVSRWTARGALGTMTAMLMQQRLRPPRQRLRPQGRSHRPSRAWAGPLASRGRQSQQVAVPTISYVL